MHLIGAFLSILKPRTSIRVEMKMQHGLNEGEIILFNSIVLKFGSLENPPLDSLKSLHCGKNASIQKFVRSMLYHAAHSIIVTSLDITPIVDSPGHAIGGSDHVMTCIPGNAA